MIEAEEKSKRIPVEQCRELLGDDGKNLSDRQVEVLRDTLYVLGENVLDELFNPNNKSQS